MRPNWDGDENPNDLFDQMQDMMDKLAGGDAVPVEVHEYDEHVDVVADVPEAEEEDIEIDCDGRTLVLRVSAGSRPTTQRVDLPTYVEEEPSSASFNNGVLQLTFDRTTDPANIGFY